MGPPARAILFAGDSITRGLPGASYFDMVAGRLSRSPRWDGFRALNAGRGGDTAAALLHRLPGVLARRRPRWMVIAVGHNDVWLPLLRSQDGFMDLFLDARARLLNQAPAPDLQKFEAGYRELLELAQDCVGPRAVVCTCSVIGEDLASPANLAIAQANALIQRLASERGMEVADPWALFQRRLAGRPAPSDSPRPPDGFQYVRDRLRARIPPPPKPDARRGFRLTLDGVHPNAKGAALWAQAVWDALEAASARLGT